MTYISAFQCVGGVVMVADRQETYPYGSMKDEKEYVEKLYVPENLEYPVAVGGAGVGEPILVFSLELFESIEKQPPSTAREMRSAIKATLDKIHSSDKVISAWPSAYNTTRCIVAAKPTNEDFCIFVTTGKQVGYRERKPVLVGYKTPANKALLERMYRPTMSVAQGVIVGAYLVAQARKLNPGVDGIPKIATVASHGAFVEDEKYVELLEKRADELLTAFDDLFLLTADAAVPDHEFDKHLATFQEGIREKRFKYSREASMSIYEKILDPKWKGDAYAKLPDFSSMSVGAAQRCIMFRDKKPWLSIPDGYTDDGRAKIRLVPLNSPEAQGKTSWEQAIPLVGVAMEQLSTPEGRLQAHPTLSSNADKLRSILRSDRSTAQGWTQLKPQNP
jgi:hypothetical protein